MDYILESLSIKDLIHSIESDNLDLSPSYQREFIWSLKDQKDLIGTIEKKYPLPNLFINILGNRKMEMVDGQQRARSIFRFYKNEIKFSKNDPQKNLTLNDFLSYKLPVILIKNAKPEEIRELYYLINKKGKFLNNPEVQLAEHHDKLFLKLSDELTTNQTLINLDLFSGNTISRMNDRDFIQELLAYLIMYQRDKENNENQNYEGLREKKIFIESEIFKNDISQADYENLHKIFLGIIEKITTLDEYIKINTTRYKQRNDFYTLFNFINKHDYLEPSILLYQYRILLELDKKDIEGNQYIRPTNENCISLKSYAINCVSQSNSKIARKGRLDFFENILLNKFSEVNNNEILSDILIYLSEIYGEEKVAIKKIESYYLLDVDLLK
jgi:hypothetical protein